MNCPGKIAITIENIEEKKAARNLVCYVEILAKKKNNYTLGPFLTDESGKIVLTKKIILDTITEWMNEYPMDYVSDLSDCRDEIVVKIYPIEKLKERVTILEKFYPDEAKKLRVLLGRAQNDRLAADFQKTYKISESIKCFVNLLVDARRQDMTSAINPFIYSRAVTPAEFLGRKRELRFLFNRLATGQSTAIIGQPHIGKTSLLNYMLDAETRQASFGAQFDRDVFSFLDAQTLHGVKTQSGFWERVLAPLKDCLQSGQPEHLKSLAPIYEVTRENQFGTFVLEQLFKNLNAAGSRLVLLLDEFDDFLSHPVLNDTEFYGGLRSLASRSAGLALVIAARRDLEQLNQLTQAINPHGSAYFNVFTEIKLGSLSKEAFSGLLKRAGDGFDRWDEDYVTAVSGRHPYLAQAAGAMLWDAHEEGKMGTARYREVGRTLYRETKKHFADTWRSWTNQTRKAITAVALAHIPRLLTEHKFRVSDLVEDLADYSAELDTLEAEGMLTQDNEGEWMITQGAFLWWLADELRRNVRDDTEFRTWLQAQEMDGLFTPKQRQRMGEAAQKVMTVVSKGATTLIESLAKGFGERIGKG